VPLGGVAPTYAAIADGRYPGARPLYVYAKIAHLAAVPGLRAFLRTYAASWGPGGPLVRRGLIAAPADVRAAAAATIARETRLDPRTLR
jgi:phosphate transport system substrate-binding protein